MMYIVKARNRTNLYKNFTPRFQKQREIEVRAYVSHAICADLSKSMKDTVRAMAFMIAEGVSGGDNNVRK